jgi:hypothetical protein
MKRDNLTPSPSSIYMVSWLSFLPTHQNFKPNCSFLSCLCSSVQTINTTLELFLQWVGWAVLAQSNLMCCWLAWLHRSIWLFCLSAHSQTNLNCITNLLPQPWIIHSLPLYMKLFQYTNTSNHIYTKATKICASFLLDERKTALVSTMACNKLYFCQIGQHLWMGHSNFIVTMQKNKHITFHK